jgi:hypothetical protein
MGGWKNDTIDDRELRKERCWRKENEEWRLGSKKQLAVFKISPL